MARTVLAESRVSVFLWGFAVAWCAMVAAFAGLFLRDGPPGQLPGLVEWLILAVFVLTAVGVAAFALHQETVRVEWDGTWAYLVRRRPGRRREIRFGGQEVASLLVLEESDSDGDAYFRCLLELPGEPPATVAEGHDRGRVAGVRARLASALGYAGPMS